MVTLNEIIKLHAGESIPRKMRRMINKWIDDPDLQHYIKKALDCDLQDEDYRYLYKVGNQKSTYPGLYYLCCIYIHPMTKLRGLWNKYERNIK